MPSSTDGRAQSLHHGHLQRPPTASTPLWAHLLRPSNHTPSSLTDLSAVAPPLAPLDKNATSMRVLLHDTQSNFEKFSTHVENLLDGIKATKQQIMTTNSLFERDRESLMGDIIDLVNRSQREIQKSTGTPSQSQDMESSFKDINTRLNGLDHRLDAVQAFNQTHSQALQTQIQAVQILLDKQGSIITAVLPLLPLIQALPLHIDAAKTSISETVFKLYPNRPHLFSTIPGSSIKNFMPSNNILKRKRSNAPSSSSSPLSPTHAPQKKIRAVDSFSSPIYMSSKTAVETPLKTSANHNPKPTPLQIRESVPTSDISPPLAAAISSLHNANRRQTTMGPSITPRRPLGDLPIPSSLRRSSRKDPSFSRHGAQGATLTRSNTLAAEFPSNNLLGLTPSAARPPRLLRVHSSITNNTQRASSLVSNHSPNLSVPPPVSSTAKNHPSTQPVLPLNVTGPHTMTNTFDLIPRLNVAQGAKPAVQTQHQVAENISLSMGFNMDVPTKSIEKAPMLMLANRVKERRSPTREGRRFIPLVDSDDEEEEEAF